MDKIKLKFKYIIFTIVYIVITLIIIELLQNRHYIKRQLECKYLLPELKPFKTPSFKWKNTGLITIWLDDGWASQYTSALPIMQAFGYKGVISIITSTVCEKEYMTWRQIYKINNEGWEVVAHSHYHICNPYILENSPKLLHEETATNKKILEDYKIYTKFYVTPCGYPPDLFPKVKKSILQSFPYIRTAQGALLNYLPIELPTQLDSYAIDDRDSIASIQKLINQAKEEQKWLILLFHEVGRPGASLNISESNFKEILSRVKQSQLPVVLPSQVLSYVSESST